MHNVFIDVNQDSVVGVFVRIVVEARLHLEVVELLERLLERKPAVLRVECLDANAVPVHHWLGWVQRIGVHVRVLLEGLVTELLRADTLLVECKEDVLVCHPLHHFAP